MMRVTMAMGSATMSDISSTGNTPYRFVMGLRPLLASLALFAMGFRPLLAPQPFWFAMDLRSQLASDTRLFAMGLHLWLVVAREKVGGGLLSTCGWTLQGRRWVGT